jgi:hypothetical protein
MRMQEPEQWQQSGQEWQPSQEYGEYRAEYPGRDQPEQQQRIYPQEERSLYAKALWIITIVLSSIAFFLTVAGIVGSAIVLKYANGQAGVLAGGIIGLVSSIGAMLMCVAIFVIAVVAVARPDLIRGWRTRPGRSALRQKSSQ